MVCTSGFSAAIFLNFDLLLNLSAHQGLKKLIPFVMKMLEPMMKNISSSRPPGDPID